MYARVVQLNLPKVQHIDIEFANLTYEARVGFRGPMKQILKGVTGSFRSGELTAIMGPSGAGKSTLLNILTGFERNNWRGTVEYVGSGGKHCWKQYRKQACYIQQDDQLQPLFTTMEVMSLAADLKIGNSLSAKAKQMLIHEILESLDLMKAKDTRCERLSGGQQKRLSIALELIDNPPVMLLDEPTTGLDSLTSFQLVTVLQNLARAGRTIICTIHQPSAALYELIDHVYLVADGRCMYQGSANNTVAYFAGQGLQCPHYHNPADYMIEVVSKEYGNFNEQLAKAAQSSKDSWRSNKPRKTVFEKAAFEKSRDKTAVLINPPAEWIRFWILLNHSLVQLYRDWTFSYLRLLIHSLVGFFLGLFYTDMGSNGAKSINNVSYFLVTVVYLCYTSMMPAVFRLPSELPVLRKERFNNWYQLKTYYIALLIANTPLHIAFAVFHTSISYFLSSQPPELYRFLMFVAVAILTALIADSFGLVIGTLLNPVNGTFVGAICTASMLIFGGFLALFKHMPVLLYYVSYISYLRYSLHGLMLAIYGFNREKLPCPPDVRYCHYRMPQLLMEEFGMTDRGYWTDIIVLIANLVILRIIAYCSLKRKLSSI